jgi:hypothetical protein
MDMLMPFYGTAKPRLLRVIDALLLRPHTREEIDRVGGASNGPALISELRALGLEVPCDRRTVVDRDGKAVKPGIYSFTGIDKMRVEAWMTRRGAARG